jgi:hypothetical protein
MNNNYIIQINVPLDIKNPNVIETNRRLKNTQRHNNFREKLVMMTTYLNEFGATIFRRVYIQA